MCRSVCIQNGCSCTAVSHDILVSLALVADLLFYCSRTCDCKQEVVFIHPLVEECWKVFPTWKCLSKFHDGNCSNYLEHVFRRVQILPIFASPSRYTPFYSSASLTPVVSGNYAVSAYPLIHRADVRHSVTERGYGFNLLLLIGHTNFRMCSGNTWSRVIDTFTTFK